LAHTTVHLVRHGHVIWTPDEDRVLSPEGRAGAEQVATLLAGEPISAVYASTMRRAIQTVEPLARSLALPVTALEALRERRLSGGPVDDHGAAVAWCWANPEAALPGGESNHAARRRGVAAITELVGRQKNQVIVVGSHGNLLALILQHWFPSVDHAFWSQLTMPDIYTLTLRDDGSPEFARRWDAESRFVPKSRGSDDV
jgi:2,3-bisphosphoglycerate-dependent phosphoglycerate mutase